MEEKGNIGGTSERGERQISATKNRVVRSGNNIDIFVMNGCILSIE